MPASYSDVGQQQRKQTTSWTFIQPTGNLAAELQSQCLKYMVQQTNEREKNKGGNQIQQRELSVKSVSLFTCKKIKSNELFLLRLHNGRRKPMMKLISDKAAMVMTYVQHLFYTYITDSYTPC
jgi:hypothetical protein